MNMIFPQQLTHLLDDPHALTAHIQQALHKSTFKEHLFTQDSVDSTFSSSVLFLLGCRRIANGGGSIEPCLILNKRSAKVRQPGDLCCPGGSISAHLDATLGRLLFLPGSPLKRWANWPLWYTQDHQTVQNMALLFATGLREGFEEMRLNPLGVKFLGPLPPEKLVMFKRVIYPLVCWIPRQTRFRPNWEVEKVVHIPVRNLLDPKNYARYLLRIDIASQASDGQSVKEFRCFIHEEGGTAERLWGATFRITIRFLEIVFGFKPPQIGALQTVEGQLDENYLTGNG
jgi:hypothetical protein